MDAKEDARRSAAHKRARVWDSPLLTGRYVAPAPVEWERKSAFLLELWRPEAKVVRDAFALSEPIPPQQLPEFLLARAREGLKRDPEAKRAFASLLPGAITNVPLGDPGFATLIEASDRVVAQTGCERWEAVEFLLCDTDFTMPWISITWAYRETGHRFTIDVGTSEVTAEDVRCAYVAALAKATGSPSSRAKSSDSIALAVKDLQGRMDARPWRVRWAAWKDYAKEVGATEYRTLDSYRLNVQRVLKDIPWLAQWADEIRTQAKEQKATSS